MTVAASSSPTEVTAVYNPGGIIPEVEPRSTWGLFGLIFAVLAFLLVLPGIIGRAGVLVSGRGLVPGRSKKAKSAKGRIRLTGESRPPEERSR